MRRLLIYGIIIIICFIYVINYYTSTNIDFFANYDVTAQTRTELIQQDNIAMETVSDAVDGADNILPTKTISKCKPVNLSDPYKTNRVIMNECSNSVTPLFRGLRYTQSNKTTTTDDEATEPPDSSELLNQTIG